MLALAIEFSRCSRDRTLKAEQCARRQRVPAGASAIDLESPQLQSTELMSMLTGVANGSLERR
jgi:hypothetical protein